MSAVIDQESQAQTAGATAAEPDTARLERLLKVAGEVAGRTVLAVGSGRLANLLSEAGAEQVAVSEASAEGVQEHEGAFPRLTFTQDYDVVLVAAGFEHESDPLPRIARACGAARQEVLAWFPERKRSWFGRKAPQAEDEVFHEPGWVKRLFEMAGASSSEKIKAKGGYIVRARFDD